MAFHYAPDGCGLATTIASIGKVQIDIPHIERPDNVVLDIEGFGTRSLSLDEVKDLARMINAIVRSVDRSFTI